MMYRFQLSATFAHTFVGAIERLYMSCSAIAAFVRHFIPPLDVVNAAVPSLPPVMFPAKPTCGCCRGAAFHCANTGIHNECSGFIISITCKLSLCRIGRSRNRTTSPTTINPGESSEQPCTRSSIFSSMPVITVSPG
jgi:hypothetical protein